MTKEEAWYTTIRKVRFHSTQESAATQFTSSSRVIITRSTDLYTDDGHGKGDYVASSPSRDWIRKIAQLLDDDLMVEERG